jgi:hypothetical protein
MVFNAATLRIFSNEAHTLSERQLQYCNRRKLSLKIIKARKGKKRVKDIDILAKR